MAANDLNPALYDPVENTHGDVAEVPSANWGWTGESRGAMRTGALLVAVFLLFMMHGNHTGMVEDLYLIGFAAVLVGIVIRDVIVRRKPR